MNEDQSLLPQFYIRLKLKPKIDYIFVLQCADNLFYLVGRGSRKGAAQMCMTCHGTGMQVRMHQIIPGMVQQVSTVCQSCQGQGQRISHKDRCKACGGRKIMRQKKILEVHIDKGESEGRINLNASMAD